MILRKYVIPIVLIFGFSGGYASALNVYGYFDIESEINNKQSGGNIWSFDQHHLNIISIYKIDPKFVLFTEMEWEHGPFHSGKQNVGNIYLTRAWLEYKHSDAIKFQTGKFLLPFGIYGVRYDATPTYTSVTISSAIYGKYLNSAGVQDRLFAKYVTGVQFTGTSIINNWSLEYFINLSNGRGPKPAEEDTNTDKGLGARILTQSPMDMFQLGASYYSDRDGNSKNIRQNVYGMDARFHLGESTIESEVILVEDEILDSGSKLTGKYRQRVGVYAQYTHLLGDNLSPYLRVESFCPDDTYNLGDDHNIIWGVNYSITPRIYLKADINNFSFKKESQKDYKQIACALTVAF